MGWAIAIGAVNEAWAFVEWVWGGPLPRFAARSFSIVLTWCWEKSVRARWR
jgi:hypothetical protein